MDQNKPPTVLSSTAFPGLLPRQTPPPYFHHPGSYVKPTAWRPERRLFGPGGNGEVFCGGKLIRPRVVEIVQARMRLMRGG